MTQALESNQKNAVGLESSGLPPAGTADSGNTWADVARREAQLVKSGFAGFGEAATEAFKSDNIPVTVGKVALSMGLAFTLGRLRPVSAVGQQLLRSAGLAAGLGFGMDVAANGWEVGKAMADAAGSHVNWQKDTDAMKSSFGQFAFDTALTVPFAVGGGALGNRLAKTAVVAESTFSPPSSPRLNLGLAREDEAVPQYFSNERDGIETFAKLQAQGYMPPPLMARSPELVQAVGSVVNTPGLLRSNPNALTSALNGVHRRVGLPDAFETKLVDIEGEEGRFKGGLFALKPSLVAAADEAPDAAALTTNRAKMTSLVIHEDTHLEQINEAVRRIADKLGLGKDWLRSDVDAVISHFPETAFTKLAGKDNEMVNPDFVQSILKLRNGVPQGPAEARRADLLLGSIDNHVQGHLLNYYDYTTRHFMSELANKNFENGYDAFSMMNNDWTYAPLRADVNRIAALAATNPKEMTPTQAGMEIYALAEKHLPNIASDRAALLRFGQQAHEAEAYSVERKGFNEYNAAYASGLPFRVPTWEEFYGLAPMAGSAAPTT